MDFKGKDIISVNDLSKEEIVKILGTAALFDKKPDQNLLPGKILATLFFEPSTRTRLSFMSAMQRLGGKNIGFANPDMTSIKKGETLFDTIKMVENYSDIIVIRHPLDGAARVAAEATSKPVINAGDGANQHPTQTLLDLYTIKKTQGRLTGLKIAMVGDLKYGRTVHSLTTALSLFGSEMFFVSPKSLKMPSSYLDALQERKISYIEHEKIEDVIDKVDILYMTRIQQERFPDPIEYNRVKNVYTLTASMLGNAKKNLKVLHPLPRVTEIAPDVDDTKYAYYFEQARNGIPVRQAVLALVGGGIG